MVYWILDYFKILYDQYKSSGVSVREFCKGQGLKENSFYYWINIIKKRTVPSPNPSNEFLPISHECARNLLETSRSQETRHPQIHNVKLTYPNGVVLEMDNVRDMDAIMKLLTLNR